MSLDISQFHQTFFEESFEGLDAMESGLLGLDPQQAEADPEVVNAIFRAAHSIKGGAGTFGFMEIGGFTHLLETLLEELRSRKRAWNAEIIDTLLKSVDSTRAMLGAARAGETVQVDEVIAGALQDILAGQSAATQAPAETGSEEAAHGPRLWTIRFAPEADIAQQGNDPLRILSSLAELGRLEVEADLSQLQSLPEHDAETCPLRWTLRLETSESEADIREMFAWVDDVCELEVVAEKPVVASPEAAVAKPAPAAKTPRADTADKSAKRDTASSIRVSVEKIDSLINLVGELVITQAMLQQRAGELDPVAHESLLAGLGQLDRNTRHLQEAVMATRMLPVDFVFSRFPRLVRDTAAQLGKSVRLITEGEGAELDKGVIEKIVDPLNHIVRNAIDHGVESPAQRKAAGKDETATVRLAAWHQGGNIVIEVADDGKGLSRDKILAKARANGLTIADNAPDADVWNLIFMPGLSTAEAVTDLSGRGVGMDVVKKNIQSLGGAVEVSSATGEGTRVTIRLPLTLAILDGMTVRVGEEIMVLPLAAVVESLQVEEAQLRSVGGAPNLLRVREDFVPLVRLRDFFGYGEDDGRPPSLAVVVEDDREKLALVIDELVGQQQVVVKNLETHYRPVPGVAGATILGDGRVALIVDVGGLRRAVSPRMQAA